MRCSIGFALALTVLSSTSCGDREATSFEDVCESSCARYAECLPPEDQSPDCEADCLCFLGISLSDAACTDVGPAMLQLYACTAALSCEDLFAYGVRVPPDGYPCKAAFDDLRDSMSMSCSEALLTCFRFMQADVGAFEVQP
jgi:hypothetical protein